MQGVVQRCVEVGLCVAFEQLYAYICIMRSFYSLHGSRTPRSGQPLPCWDLHTVMVSPVFLPCRLLSCQKGVNRSLLNQMSSTSGRPGSTGGGYRSHIVVVPAVCAGRWTHGSPNSIVCSTKHVCLQHVVVEPSSLVLPVDACHQLVSFLSAGICCSVGAALQAHPPQGVRSPLQQCALACSHCCMPVLARDCVVGSVCPALQGRYLPVSDDHCTSRTRDS